MSIRSMLANWLFPDNNQSEKRARVDDPIYWKEFFDSVGYRSSSGVNVTADTALQCTTVFACIRVLAETLGSLPLKLFKRRMNGDGRDIADTHDLYYLLHDQPNPDQTAFEFRSMQVGHLCLRGNFYGFKEITPLGRINAIYSLHPERMRVERQPDASIKYTYTHDNGLQEEIPQKYIWHLKLLSKDGLTGMSPITQAREAIGIALTSEKYQAKFIANYARPGFALKVPGKLDNDQRERLKDQMQEAYTGEGAYKTMVFEGGLDYVQLGMNNDDAQFLELRNFQVEDIARIFRVPTMLIGHSGDKLNTYASAEQMMLSFIMHTIRPWASNYEQSVAKDLLNERDKKRYYAEFQLNDFIRGDIKTRFDAYLLAVQTGLMCPDEVRELENLNPLPDGKGKLFFMPMNIGELGKDYSKEAKENAFSNT